MPLTGKEQHMQGEGAGREQIVGLLEVLFFLTFGRPEREMERTILFLESKWRPLLDI